MAIKIDYVELSVSNIAAAKQFYGQAFGWEFNDYGDEYAGVKGGADEVAGITIGKTPPLPLFRAQDLEKVREAVKAAGGTIVKDIFAYPGGRRFHFRDPGGNELAVYCPAT